MVNVIFVGGPKLTGLHLYLAECMHLYVSMLVSGYSCKNHGTEL